MSAPITVLWLVDEPDVPIVSDERCRHVVSDPALAGSAIAGLLARGPVLAVVSSEEEGERAIGLGADEVILASEVTGVRLDKALDRTQARARARMQRDLFLIDLVRKDDTSALALLAAALGEEVGEPLARATEESQDLAAKMSEGDASAERMRAIAQRVGQVTEVVERMRELVNTAPTDEVVDFAAVVRDVTHSLESVVRPVATLEVRIVERKCQVGLPRWQAAMVVASLIANAVESVAERGGGDRKIAVSVAVQDAAAVLEVADDGIGMDDEQRAYAADPFYTTGGKGHLGLGLTLVSARVRRAGGEIMIESDQGVGTTVRVFVPLLDEPVATDPPN